MHLKATTITLTTNSEGYLVNLSDWTETAAKALAAKDSVDLDTDRWTIIHLLRDFYLQYQLHPPMRVLLKKLKEESSWSSDKANSLYLHQLFPEGPIKQASRYAGLPKPLKCL